MTLGKDYAKNTQNDFEVAQNAPRSTWFKVQPCPKRTRLYCEFFWWECVLIGRVWPTCHFGFCECMPHAFLWLRSIHSFSIIHFWTDSIINHSASVTVEQWWTMKYSKNAGIISFVRFRWQMNWKWDLMWISSFREKKHEIAWAYSCTTRMYTVWKSERTQYIPHDLNLESAKCMYCSLDCPLDE